MAIVYAPIWKDTYYTSTADSITYSVKVGGQTIFNGKAVKLPGAERVEVNVSLICRNFMSNELPDLRNISSETMVTNPMALRKFDFYSSDIPNSYESFTFLWDWSYSDWNGGSKSMSSPINGHYNGSMLVLSSVTYGSSTVRNTITPGSGNYCGKMALYYQGAAGGWNSFLIEGNVMKLNKVTNHNISRRVKNTSIDFENLTYSKDIEPTYDLYTGWLTDAQSENLAENLLQSPRIYAHDLVNDRIFPVTIIDTNIQYKTFKTNSNKPINYVIRIQESQSRIRR